MSKLFCRHDNTYTGVYDRAMLLDNEPFDSMSIDNEAMLIQEALDKVSTKLKQTLREWPICGNGGVVTVGYYVLDRQAKDVYGYWRCTCQEQNEFDEDTVEMDVL